MSTTNKLTEKYNLPSIDFLRQIKSKTNLDDENIPKRTQDLKELLNKNNLSILFSKVFVGSRVTRFEFLLTERTRIEDVIKITFQIAELFDNKNIRITSLNNNSSSIGIEFPNICAEIVGVRSLLESQEWKSNQADIPMILGNGITGKNIILDLAKIQNLLIAGATGSGKSVCLNTMIISLLYKFNPEDLRLILIDPKVVEFSMYANIPHLEFPAIIEPDEAISALSWAIYEMKKRYNILSETKENDIESFNSRDISNVEHDKNGKLIPKKLPRIVIVIDELADLMMEAKNEVEKHIAELAEKSRDVGIHLIIATQRPSVDIITPQIKKVCKTRIAFKVVTPYDSETILDSTGAESLLGYGDMLYKTPSEKNLKRIQGPFVTDEEIIKIVNSISEIKFEQPEFQIFKEIKVLKKEEKDPIELAVKALKNLIIEQ